MARRKRLFPGDEQNGGNHPRQKSPDGRVAGRSAEAHQTRHYQDEINAAVVDVLTCEKARRQQQRADQQALRLEQIRVGRGHIEHVESAPRPGDRQRQHDAHQQKSGRNAQARAEDDFDKAEGQVPSRERISEIRECWNIRQRLGEIGVAADHQQDDDRSTEASDEEPVPPPLACKQYQ